MVRLMGRCILLAGEYGILYVLYIYIYTERERVLYERGLGLTGMLQTPVFRDVWPRTLENL
jgi:hypothetical protein